MIPRANRCLTVYLNLNLIGTVFECQSFTEGLVPYLFLQNCFGGNLSEISPNQRIIARFSFFVVACLYENLPLVVSNLFLDWWRCKNHQIGEEKCFPHDTYFGRRLKLAIHDSRCIYICIQCIFIQ